MYVEILLAVEARDPPLPELACSFKGRGEVGETGRLNSAPLYDHLSPCDRRSPLQSPAATPEQSGSADCDPEVAVSCAAKGRELRLFLPRSKMNLRAQFRSLF